MTKYYRATYSNVIHNLGIGMLLLVLVAGCSAAGVLATNDPYEKIAQAEQLRKSGRIAVSQRLLLEAIGIFEEGNDYSGLAEAYRLYGFHLRAYGDETLYLLNPSAPPPEPTNHDNRLDKSIAYFEKSREVAEAHSQYDLVTNLHYNVGISLRYAGRLEEACQAFDRSWLAHRKAAEVSPNRELDLPAGFNSYQELISWVKEDNQCP